MELHQGVGSGEAQHEAVGHNRHGRIGQPERPRQAEDDQHDSRQEAADQQHISLALWVAEQRHGQCPAQRPHPAHRFHKAERRHLHFVRRMRQQRVADEDGNQDVERERECPERADQNHQVADGRRLPDIAKAFTGRVPDPAQGVVGFRFPGCRRSRRQADEQQADNNGARQKRIAEKRDADLDSCGQQQPRDGGTEGAGGIEDAGIERNRARHVFFGDDLRHERLPGRHIKRGKETRQPRKEQDVPDLHFAFRRQDAKTQSAQNQAALRHQEHLALVHAVGDNAGQQREQEDRQAAGKVHPAGVKVRSGFNRRRRVTRPGPGRRAGRMQQIPCDGVYQQHDQPALREILRPGADERDQLPNPEDAEIAVFERPERAGLRGGLSGNVGRKRLRPLRVNLCTCHKSFEVSFQEDDTQFGSGAVTRPRSARPCSTVFNAAAVGALFGPSCSKTIAPAFAAKTRAAICAGSCAR